MIEEPVAAGERRLGGGEILLEHRGGAALHRVLGAGNVADPRRIVDAREEGMDARGAPGKDRHRLELIPRIGGQHLCGRTAPVPCASSRLRRVLINDVGPDVTAFGRTSEVGLPTAHVAGVP